MLIRILLADDHALIRSAVGDLLANQAQFEVVARVADAKSALDKTIELKPDVLLLDIDMPGLVSFEAAREAHRLCPSTKIVFLSAFSHDRYIEQALAAHASAYVTKSASPEELIAAIHSVANGGTYFSPEIVARLVVESDGVRLIREGHTRGVTLTDREVEVLRYVSRGLSKKEIAGILNLSVRTIDTHVRNVMDKLGIHDRVELARYAIREGLSEP